MSAYKWQLAADLLDSGVPVLLADPDVVLLRNPVTYIVRRCVCLTVMPA